MRVLICCEESQRVSCAFRELGIEAYSVDLVACSGGHPEFHVMGDALDLAYSKQGKFLTMDGIEHSCGGWDLIIAHPPCTYLSSVSACRLFDEKGKVKDWERERRGRVAREFFMKLLEAPADRVCVENPAPLKYFNLPKYSQIVEPYYFGDPWKKRTCLWLCGLSDLVATNVVAPTSCWVVDGGGESCRIKLKGDKPAKSQRDRSKTFPGIAAAMAAQWGLGINENISFFTEQQKL